MMSVSVRNLPMHGSGTNTITSFLLEWSEIFIDNPNGVRRKELFQIMSTSTGLEDSKPPYFGKTLTRSMLQRTERLGIPKWFLHEHGDKFQTALSLTGPSGKSRPVTLIVRDPDARPRVYLSHGWIGFAKENGFRMGDEVIFWLVASSRFHVLVCSTHFLHKATFTTKDVDDDCDDTVISRHRKANYHTRHDDMRIPRCRMNSNPAEAHDVLQTLSCGEVKPFVPRPSSNVREEEYVKYPGLTSAIRSNSPYPHFVKKLTPNNLNTKRSGVRLELPFAFVREHGDKLQEHVALIGPSGRNLRVVNLSVSTFFGQDRVHLGKGWKDFSHENGCSEGDVLLFSLVRLSTFVVLMFQKLTE